VETIFKGYGLEGEGLRHIVDAITNNRQRWVDFMMRFELGLERPDPTRAPISAATVRVIAKRIVCQDVLALITRFP
jgi:hypothetical protein